MKYKHIYKLLNEVYNFNYKNEHIIEDYINLYENINISYTEDIETNKILKSFHIKNLAFQGIKFNNLHLILNKDIFCNFLNSLIKREIFNKNSLHKHSINLHLYYDNDNFNLEELKKIELFNSIFNKKYVYVYNLDIINDIRHYFLEQNFQIIFLIKEESELSGYKQNIQIEFNNNTVKNIKKYFEIINSNDNIKNVYTIINSKKTSTINEYFSVLKEMKALYPNIFISDKSYLLGEHLGIDENNNFYMKLNTEIFYPTEKKSFQDYYIEYNTFSEECLNCEECIFCITNMLENQCPHKKLI